MSNPMRQQGGRLLVVEDQPELRTLLRLILERESFIVEEAEDGATALSQLRSVAVDLILLDLTLPDMNGLILFEIIQAQDPLRHVPVIFLTGELAQPQRLRALEVGAVDYITKPFDPKELVARIRSQLRQKTINDRRREEAAKLAEVAQASLKAAERRITALVQNSFDMVTEYDGDLNCDYVSPNHFDIISRAPDTLLGSSWSSWLHEEDTERCRAALKETFERKTGSCRLLIRMLDGMNLWRWIDAAGAVYTGEDGKRRLLMVSRDVTQVKEQEMHLKHMALHDPLTDLGNRPAFASDLADLVAQSSFLNRSALIFLDVDNFKLINDTKGHLVGDDVLRTVASMLRLAVNLNHTIYRPGGDEIMILLRDVDEEKSRLEAETIVAMFRNRPITSENHRFGITVSVGVAMIEEGLSDKEIISRADSALYAAKAHGKNRFEFYNPEDTELQQIRSAAEWCDRLQEELRLGNKSQALEVWYQPLVRVSNGQIIAHEALLRFRDTQGQLHNPGAFLPAAERYNLMRQIDRFVLQRVFKDMQDHPTLNSSINLSGHSVSDSQVMDFIQSLFESLEIHPSRVIFEITETVFITNLDAAKMMATDLQSTGCRFALDDFGSGFSSLNYLKNLPVNLVKIDGAFIQQLGDDLVDYALLKSINEIAHLLGKETIAEFVDSASTLTSLRTLGIDYAQGFHLGIPCPLSEIEFQNFEVEAEAPKL